MCLTPASPTRVARVPSPGRQETDVSARVRQACREILTLSASRSARSTRTARELSHVSARSAKTRVSMTISVASMPSVKSTTTSQLAFVRLAMKATLTRFAHLLENVSLPAP